LTSFSGRLVSDRGSQVFAIISRALSANDEQMAEQHTQTPPTRHPYNIARTKQDFGRYFT